MAYLGKIDYSLTQIRLGVQFMALIAVLALVDMVEVDQVRYMPNFADPYRGKLAEVLRIYDMPSRQNSDNPSDMYQWIEVRFLEDGAIMTLPSIRFLLEERRSTTRSARN